VRGRLNRLDPAWMTATRRVDMADGSGCDADQVAPIHIIIQTQHSDENYQSA
jgi:hypothetical protein